MLRQVTALAGRYDIPVQVAVEEAMACGIGVCMTCVLPVTGSDGITRMVRSCVDGPVFRGEQVRWDDVGTIPFDAFGAPGWEPRSSGPRAPAAARRQRQGPGGAARTAAGGAAMTDLRTRLGHVELPNPILTASGCASSGRELAQFIDVSKIGAVVTKSVMLGPRAGRPTPRMAETPSGMLNSIGLQGPGIDSFLQRDLPWLLSRGRPRRGVDRRRHRGRVRRAGRAAVRRGRRHRHRGQHLLPERRAPRPGVRLRPGRRRRRSIEAVRGRTRYDIPVFAKLSPDVTDIVAIAKACVSAGADGLSLINTLLGMVIDTDTMRPVLAGVTGGLSGPAIRPIAVRCIWQVREALPDVPIIGMGGVRTGQDALELILAGASMVSVGTTIFHDPSACARILRELDEELARRGVERLSDVVGLAHEPRAAARRRLSGTAGVGRTS